MPQIICSVFCPLGKKNKIKEAANEYNLISPTSWLCQHQNTCMDSCHVLKKWLWMHAKVFSTAINTGPTAAVPLPVSVPVSMCQSLVSYRDRTEERRGQMKSEVVIIAH